MAKHRLHPDTWIPWEPYELQVLRDNPLAHDKDIAVALPGRTEDAVKQKRYTTGLRRSFNGVPLGRGELVVSVYDQVEQRMVIEAGTLRQCSDLLGISIPAIQYERYRHMNGFTPPRYVIEEVCPPVVVRRPEEVAV